MIVGILVLAIALNISKFDISKEATLNNFYPNFLRKNTLSTSKGVEKIIFFFITVPFNFF